MVLKEHTHHHERLRPYFGDRMLLLGSQEMKIPGTLKEYFNCEVTTLDVNGRADVEEDWNAPTTVGTYASVYNLGTLEHIWSVHQAYCNALSCVELGGHYLHHSPCEGYAGHGIHVTAPEYLIKFVGRNGFDIVDAWYSLQNGTEWHRPRRAEAKNVILWMSAKRVEPDRGVWELPYNT